MKKTLSILLTLLLLSSISCSPRLTAKEEADATQATLVWLDDTYGIIRTREMSTLLERVSQRIANATIGNELVLYPYGVKRDILRKFPFQVMVIDHKVPNAFTTGQGIVILTSGMLRETRTEAELAAILCHELAHQLLGHTRKALGQTKKARSWKPLTKFSLGDELQADRLSLRLMYLARYDLTHALEALGIGLRATHGQHSGVPEQWLATRMSYMHQQIAELEPFLPATQSTREFNRIISRL